MITQTLAIFLDAYRSLNAKKMFWVTLIISGLIVLAFAAVGINERGCSIVGWQIDNTLLCSRTVSPAEFHKQLFAVIGIGIWLSWAAMIPALISTAGIFPDLLTSGVIDLYVSRPISRLRLFLTQYVAGLLFVALQVTVFTAASFVVIGLRGGTWEPALFLTVPLVICFFSYLFAVCTFLGIATRSTLASLLLTLLFWFLVYAVGAAENGVLVVSTMHKHGTSLAQAKAQQRLEHTRAAAEKAGKRKTPAEADAAEPQEPLEPSAAEDSTSRILATTHKILYGVKTCLPKTTETVGLLDRVLREKAHLSASGETPEQRRLAAAQREILDSMQNRSVGWIVGTSLGFEALVLAAAAWIFRRRDF